MSEKNNVKQIKAISIIILIILLLFGLYGVQKLVNEDTETEVSNSIFELNKITPILVDKFTRLDSASLLGRASLTYYYTLIETEKSEINIDTFYNSLRPSIIENVKHSPELRVYRAKNIILNYKYYDKNGKVMTEISVPPQLYKK